MQDVAKFSPHEARALIRRGEWARPTAGMAAGFVQANVVILPKAWAFDFLLFCQRNPKPCPVLDVTEPGSPHPDRVAPTADLRTDVPKYRIYRHGELVEETTDLLSHWQDDFVAFLLGCSFTFEKALLDAGIPVRHLEEGKNVPMYRTTIPCRKAGPFEGPMVVSMRPIPAQDVSRAVQVTARFPAAHGAPVHVGAPEAIGIRDLSRPDFGEAVTIREGEIPVFWACGVTPQAVAMAAKVDLMITHAPGHMFITDVRDADLSVGQ